MDVTCQWQFPQLEPQISCQLLYWGLTYLFVSIKKLQTFLRYQGVPICYSAE